MALENIVRKAKKSLKKTLALLAFGSTALASLPDAKSEVLFTLESKNSAGFPTRFWDQNKRMLNLYVHVDNRSEPSQTSGFEFEVVAPAGVTYIDPLKPSPYLNHFTFGENKDFLASQSLSSTNSTGLQTRRFAYSAGAAHTNGIGAMLYFSLDANNPQGIKTFQLKNVRAYRPDGTLQDVVAPPMSIAVISSYDDLLEKPHFIMDVYKGISYIHAGYFPRKTAIKFSSDLKEWKVVGQSQEYNGQYELEMPYNLTHTSRSKDKFYTIDILE